MIKRWIALLGVGLFGVVALASSCEGPCFNPTGYCGSNVPDPERKGGPLWVTSISTGDERVTYYNDVCAANPMAEKFDPEPSFFTTSECVEIKIRNDIHSSCVTYAPPTGGDNGVTDEERNREITECKDRLLSQHTF